MCGDVPRFSACLESGKQHRETNRRNDNLHLAYEIGSISHQQDQHRQRIELGVKILLNQQTLRADASCQRPTQTAL